jgi:hypothetical protein
MNVHLRIKITSSAVSKSHIIKKNIEADILRVENLFLRNKSFFLTITSCLSQYCQIHPPQVWAAKGCPP